ncbi:hypothetical protein C8R47DRAFT_1317918 [Mycena vitilis]|nr:hypothetical protein C8R47DRAFT_1317918 [Mycena vitilis]
MATVPILALPVVITQQIMRDIVADSIAANGRFPLPRFTEPPLSLGRVSQQWRNISQQTPELWQSIRIDDSTPTVPPQVLGLWATRAGALPLKIQLVTDDDQRGDALMVGSIASSLRWQELHLSLPVSSFSALVTHHGPFPALRKVSLSLNTNIISEDTTITILNAPLLRTVILREFPFLSVDAAWNQLTTVDMNTHDGEAGISALRHCTTLQTLRFSLMAMRPPVAGAIAPCTLPSLRHLANNGSSILPFVTVPSLMRLDIWGPGFSGGMMPLNQDLAALLARSGCTLQRLSFRMPPAITAAELEVFLHAVPSVTDFEFTTHFTGVLANVRAVLAGVLPRLDTLRVVYGPREQESLDPLLAALHARRAVVAGQAMLETFHLRVLRPAVLPSVVKTDLLALESTYVGMHISINIDP